jgi:predicted Rossmann fold flavoprotein
MLAKEAAQAGVEVRLGCSVERVCPLSPGEMGGERRQPATRFRLQTASGDYECESLVIATGGLSIPKIGATDFGYRLAQQFGLAIVEPWPALVPLTFAGEELRLFSSLSGVSVEVRVSCNGASFRENLLFTHRGLSGPAILQISSFWRPGDAISVDLLPDGGALELLLAERRDERDLAQVLATRLPRRFAQGWCELYAPSRPMRRYSERDLEAIAARLHAWQLTPAGTEGFAKAEVTAGGIDTRELTSRTMECRRVPSLYFIGEVVDVTGWLGGYNFQWAWASGYAAGQAV